MRNIQAKGHWQAYQGHDLSYFNHRYQIAKCHQRLKLLQKFFQNPNWNAAISRSRFIVPDRANTCGLEECEKQRHDQSVQ